MNAPRVFDARHYETLNKSRADIVSDLLSETREQLNLRTAADIGCGLGDFSKFLSDLGLQVLGVDGREGNVAEARLRFTDIIFRTENVEDLPVKEMGTFDLVLCFGLLYHLENPFRAIRNLYALTSTILMVEGMCAPSNQPTMDLLDEGADEDQGLTYVAFYPSESCLIKMLYRSGFPFVYLFKNLPADERYTSTIWRKRERTILVASKVALASPNLVLAKEPIRPVPGITDPWTTRLRKARAYMGRLMNPLRGRL